MREGGTDMKNVEIGMAGETPENIAAEIGITVARTRVILGARLNVAKATQARAAKSLDSSSRTD